MRAVVCLASWMPLLLTAPPARANPPYEPTWASLDSRPTPSWWQAQKFSLFMHWGLYAVPGYCPVNASQHTCYAEHFWDTSHTKGSPQQVYMEKNYGENFQYQDFAPLFRCENFDPDGWALLFQESGAQGLTMTSKHHEGWTLWPNERHANWNSVDTGPHRDLLQEVGDAVRKQGLRFGFYYSLMEWDRLYTNETGTEQARNAGYVNNTMIPDLQDLVNRYHPDVLYVDGEWSYPSDHWQTKPFLAWLFNDSPVRDTVAINDRWGNDCRGKHGGFYVCEYGGEVGGSCIANDPSHPWTAHEGMGKSFGYNRLDIYKPASYFVELLAQAVAFGGHLQLNVGPTADGRIPQVQQGILRHVGRWLGVNGEAIFNTTGHPFGIDSSCTQPPAPARRQCYTDSLTAASAAADDADNEDASLPRALAWHSPTHSEARVRHDHADSGDGGGVGGGSGGHKYSSSSSSALRRGSRHHANSGQHRSHHSRGVSAKRTLYVLTNGWPEELVFPAGSLMPAPPASAFSVVGVGSGVVQEFKVYQRGNHTVAAVPTIPVSKLPNASVQSDVFAFRVENAVGE